MTEIDLQIMFHQETGMYAPSIIDEEITNHPSWEEYVKWLKSKLLTLYNMK